MYLEHVSLDWFHMVSTDDVVIFHLHVLFPYVLIPAVSQQTLLLIN